MREAPSPNLQIALTLRLHVTLVTRVLTFYHKVQRERKCFCPGGLPYKSDEDARRLALGCELQILV